MTRLMLIINPAAGRGGFRNGLGDALNLLDKGGCRTTLFFTSAAATRRSLRRNTARILT